jgi:uracil-DNA glycosylase family 4
MTCNTCKLDSVSRKITYAQRNDAQIVIVLDSPTYMEASCNEAFSSDSVIVFKRLLEQHGIKLSSVGFEYARACCVNRDTKIPAAAIHICKERLFSNLEQYTELKYIIVVGSPATKMLLGNVKFSNVLNRATTITINGRDVKVIPTGNPAAAKYMPSVMNDIEAAIIAVNTMELNGGCKVQEVIKIDSDTTLKDAILDLSNAPLVGFDVETGGDIDNIGLKPYSPNCRLLTLALSTKEHAYWLDVDHTDGHKDWAIKLLNLCKGKVVGHNVAYDITVATERLNVTGFTFEDTLLEAFIINENTEHTLEYLAAIHIGWYDYAAGMKAKRGELAQYDVDAVGHYNALDAAATLNLHYVLNQQLSDVDKVLYEFLKQTQAMFIRMSHNGILVDLEQVAKVKLELETEQKTLLDELKNNDIIKKACKVVALASAGYIDSGALYSDGKLYATTDKQYTKEVDAQLSIPEFNTGSTQHITALLAVLGIKVTEKTAKGFVSTRAEVLKCIDSDLIQKIVRIKQIDTLISTFVEGVLKWVYEDGKIHPTYSLTTTVTGRTSCSSPNYQNIPREPMFRDYFYVPDGYKLIHYDFKSAEVYIAASFSGDKKLINALSSGTDMHKTVASWMYDIDIEEVTKETRTDAKRCTFGVLYGISPVGLSKQLGCTESEAAAKMSKYMNTFPELAQWIQSQQQYVRAHGKVHTPLGRTRNLPVCDGRALRQAVNAPIQATASDFNLWILNYLDSRLDPESAWLIGAIHDAGEIMVKDEKVNDVLHMLKEAIVQLNNVMKFLKVPVTIDVEIGQRAGSLEWIDLNTY